MQYNSIHELVSAYNHAVRALVIDFNDTPFLNVDRYNPKTEEQKLMYSVINVAEMLDLDLNYLPWFYTVNEVYPFNNTTPAQYLIKHKKKGLLEIIFYLNALVASHIARLHKSKEKAGEIKLQENQDSNHPFY